MKKRNPVYLFLSVLEGMLSGGYFYLGRRDKDPLNLLSGCMWLALSFFHGLIGLGEPEEDITLLEEFDDE